MPWHCSRAGSSPLLAGGEAARSWVSRQGIHCCLGVMHTKSNLIDVYYRAVISATLCPKTQALKDT